MKMAIQVSLLGAMLGAAGCSHRPPAPVTVRTGFDISRQVTLSVPDGVKSLKVWLILPRETAVQSTHGLKVAAGEGREVRITHDTRGNHLAVLDLQNPEPGALKLDLSCRVNRADLVGTPKPADSRPLDARERQAFSMYLAPRGAGNPGLANLAAATAGEDSNPVSAAQKIFNWMIANARLTLENRSSGEPWKGDSVRCLANGSGSATDLAALFVDLARSAGVPARQVYGTLLMSGASRPHGWVEFWAPDLGWVPVDVALGCLYAGPDEDLASPVLGAVLEESGVRRPDRGRAATCFGTLHARRIAWSSGNGLVLHPRQAGPALPALRSAYVEQDGQPVSEIQATLNWNAAGKDG